MKKRTIINLFILLIAVGNLLFLSGLMRFDSSFWKIAALPGYMIGLAYSVVIPLVIASRIFSSILHNRKDK